jgi:hypothetical protein
VYVHSVFMLHVSATQGHFQATHFLRSLLHCALGQIVLLRHAIVVIINFDDEGCFPIFCIVDVCVPLSVPLSWLCAPSVAFDKGSKEGVCNVRTRVVGVTAK